MFSSRSKHYLNVQKIVIKSAVKSVQKSSGALFESQELTFLAIHQKLSQQLLKRDIHLLKDDSAAIIVYKSCDAVHTDKKRSSCISFEARRFGKDTFLLSPSLTHSDLAAVDTCFGSAFASQKEKRLQKKTSQDNKKVIFEFLKRISELLNPRRAPTLARV